MIHLVGESPPCPKCGCPTLTMLVRTVTLTNGQIGREYSCDACGQGFKSQAGEGFRPSPAEQAISLARVRAVPE